MNADLYITTIPPEIHLLPGLGGLEYIYIQPSKHLTINCNGTEVMVLEGAAAKRVYYQVIGIVNDADPDEAVVTAAARNAWHVKFSDLKVHTRKPEVKEYRQIIMWWLCYNTKKSLNQIGWMCGNFDHATVLNARRLVDNMRHTDAVIKHKLNEFETAIKQL